MQSTFINFLSVCPKLDCFSANLGYMKVLLFF